VQAGILIEAVGAAFSTNGGHNRGFGLESRRQTSLRQKGEWSLDCGRPCKAKGANFTQELLRQIFSPPEGVSAFDTAPDGRILAAAPVEQALAPPISLVLNWDSELKK